MSRQVFADDGKCPEFRRWNREIGARREIYSYPGNNHVAHAHHSFTSHISASSNISSSIRLSRSFSVFVLSLFNALACIGLTLTSASGKIRCTRFVSSLRMMFLAPGKGNEGVGDVGLVVF